jgi:flagella basal body P-ring formation protein FlgA
MRRLLRLLAAAPLLLAPAVLATPALAGGVTLKAETVDADGRVTLGDLFDGAGAAAGVLVAMRPGPTAVLDAAAVQASARRAGLDWDNSQGLRRIVVRAGAEAGQAAVGRAANVEVLTWARSLAAGELVQPEDLVWTKTAAAPAGAPRDAEPLIGLAARRPLRAGAVAFERDVSAPQVIRSGELVAVTYSDGGITLTLQGKALAAASVGEQFAVLNTASKKTIQAVATGPGAAAVGPQSQSLRVPRTIVASR